MVAGVNTTAKKIRRGLLFTSLLVALCFAAVVELRRARIESPEPVKVIYKTATELAKIPVEHDSYPCLLAEPVEPGLASSHWRADVTECSPALHNDAAIEQYEVDLRSGKFILRKTDLFVADDLPLALTRGYVIWDTTPRAFGVGGNQPYDIFPYGTRFPYTYMIVLLADGSGVRYERISEGTSYADAVFEHKGIPATVFDRSRIAWNRDHWDYTWPDGSLYRFPEAYYSKRGAEGALVAMRDSSGNEIKMERDAARNLTRLTSPHAHWIRLDYDTRNRVRLATDDSGRSVGYKYDDAGRLIEVSNIDGIWWRYSYDQHGMTRAEDVLHRQLVQIAYKNGRVESITFSGGPTYDFDYLLNRRGAVIGASVEYPKGKFRAIKF